MLTTDDLRVMTTTQLQELFAIASAPCACKCDNTPHGVLRLMLINEADEREELLETVNEEVN